MYSDKTRESARLSRFRFSKEFKLLPWCRWWHGFMGTKYFHHAELFVGDTQNSDFSQRWKKTFNPFYVYISIFSTGAMAYIYRELEHCKAVLHQPFPKPSIGFAFLFCVGRQVKKNKYPHDTVFAESVDGCIHISG